jgi:hypothetical protein
MEQSQVTIFNNGGMMFSGPDAVNLARAISVKSALRLAMVGLSIRGVTKTGLLKIASEYTGKKYKRGEYQQAREDLDLWIETMKLALPIEDKRDV